jgi:putative DNA primase/helicase
MSDDDPYGDDVEPINRGGKGKKRSPHARIPGEAPPSSDIDLFLALRAHNDIGNAERLCQRYGDKLRAVQGLGWFGWDELHWSRENGEDLALRCAIATAKSIWAEIAALRSTKTPDEDRIGYLIDHARTSGNIARLNGMLEAATPELRLPLAALDADPYLLYMPNAVLRLFPEIAEVARDRQHYATKLTAVAYDPSARSPKWLAFLAQIFPDGALREFVQRAAGYSVTGDMSEESFFMCWGKGRNGKGTFLRSLAHALGTYAATLPVELLLEGAPKSGNEASPQYAALTGVRYVLTTEPKPNARFNEGELKTLTGRDTIRIRDMYGKPFDLMPKFKMWIACNDRPIVRSTSDAYWRRVKLIPFLVNISEEQTNRYLEQELRKEAPGILNWMLEGLEHWSERGLRPPEAVLTANTSYRDEMDPLHRFLIEALVVAPGQQVKRRELYAAYTEYCQQDSEDPMPTKAFGSAMTNKGYRRKHSNGTNYIDMTFTEEGRVLLDKSESRAAARLNRGLF